MQLESSLTFPAAHPAFAGHFPGRPIVPGVLLLDAALHAFEAARSDASGAAPLQTHCHISSVKFLSPVAPDEVLTISLRDPGTGQLRFDIASGGRAVATGTFAFRPAP